MCGWMSSWLVALRIGCQTEMIFWLQLEPKRIFHGNKRHTWKHFCVAQRKMSAAKHFTSVNKATNRREGHLEDIISKNDTWYSQRVDVCGKRPIVWSRHQITHVFQYKRLSHRKRANCLSPLLLTPQICIFKSKSLCILSSSMLDSFPKLPFLTLDWVLVQNSHPLSDHGNVQRPIYCLSTWLANLKPIL